MPVVSVVICTHDKRRIPDLLECIDSVKRQDFVEYELVVVVDNNPELYRILRGRLDTDGVSLVLNNSRRRGLASAMNRGIAESRGEIICFIDDDAVADDGWLRRIVAAYDDTTHGVGGRTEPLWLAPRPVWLPEEFLWMVGATGTYLPHQNLEVRNLWSGNVSFRRKVFADAGTFLDRLGKSGGLPLQGEDTEFGIRLMGRFGKGVKYVPLAKVHHKVGPERTRLAWFAQRAYYQGYSKAFIKKKYRATEPLSMEKYFLRLLSASSVRRVRDLMAGPGRDSALLRLAFTVLAVSLVFLGFLMGSMRRTT